MLFPLSAAICLLALTYKAVDARRRPRDPALIALLIAFTGKGVSFTLSTPAVSATVDAATGVPNLGALGIHLCGGVLSSAAFLAALVHWVYPRERVARAVRARVVVAAVIGIVMVALWWSASRGGRRSAHFLLDNAGEPAVIAYLLLYVTAFGTAMTEIVRLCRRYGPPSGSSWLRRGLALTALGASACIVYCLNRAFVIVAVQLGWHPLNWEILTPIANTVGIAGIAGGLTMPSWGPRLAAAVRWCRHYRDQWQLYPLWRDVCAAVPAVALLPPTSPLRDRLHPVDVEFRLYRRVVEIRDGLLALRADPGLGTGDREALRILDTSLNDSENYADELAWLRRRAAEYRRRTGPSPDRADTDCRTDPPATAGGAPKTTTWR
ncbi:MAB_1171c family putative transporter [Actinoplanes sp. SE50/110]|uniref:MAB_1171c family putative transporter n=1 Tax=Actinoplanes sp. (strain ATCC 31044 / CBS 674.73 / SE50/110) TaxID=134676 RepID=UPI000C0721BD|nr:MAB_1171c family putative transporter [Actinoplanes sp. SE50/110]